MTEEITLKEALELVEFKQNSNGSWYVYRVHGSVGGSVHGNVGGDVDGYVCGNIRGTVHGSVGGSVHGNVGGDVDGYVRGNVGGSVQGNVEGSVYGNVGGSVRGTINGKHWQFIETPKEKLKRLIEAGADKDQLLEALNQMEDNS